jgi:hypothetical protein
LGKACKNFRKRRIEVFLARRTTGFFAVILKLPFLVRVEKEPELKEFIPATIIVRTLIAKTKSYFV